MYTYIPDLNDTHEHAEALRGAFCEHAVISCRHLTTWYDTKMALDNVSMDIERNSVTTFIGPSGCGKSTMLRCLNRMNDIIPAFSFEGTIQYGSLDIYEPTLDVVSIRKRVGMVFQKANPFHSSIRENVAYGIRLHTFMESGPKLDEQVEACLRKVHLWDEVKDRLDKPAINLSGGQQQRLCIARAIAVAPEVILMDEPCSALDPVVTAEIEQLIVQLKHEATIVLVTHSLQQAARVADRIAFFHLGRLVEMGPSENIFMRPKHPLTEEYILGRYG